MSTRVVLYALLAPALALALAGCGRPDGGEVETVNEQGTIVVAALGDSIHAGSPYWDPDPDVRASYGDDLDEQSQWEYWAARKDARLSFRNCGVWGERTDEIAERLERCAGGAEVLVVQGGINDIAQRYDVGRAAENLRGIVQEAKALGLPVAITDVLPWNNGYPVADPQIRAINLLIADIAAEEKIPLLPFHDTLEDPDAPGRMKAELTADGDHPSIEGYRLLGEQASKLPG